MKLKIEQIADRGVPNLERLHLRVLEQTNLSYHAILASFYIGEDGVANGNHLAFWFPSVDVNPGDNVIIYSRSGVYEPPMALVPVNRNFFFYWGLPQTLWNNETACAVVLDLIGWQTSPKAAPAKAPVHRPLGDAVIGLPRKTNI